MSDLLRISSAPPTASRGIDILTGYSKRFASVPVPKHVTHTARQDAERIVSCVNSLAGIEDPAALVTAMREVVEALEACADRIERAAYIMSDERLTKLSEQFFEYSDQARTALTKARAVMP